MADENQGPDATERPATPWWVKAVALAILVVLILAAIVMVVGGGRHGPGMHGPSGTGLSPASPTAYEARA
ncbi:MAG: hypothetical protein M3301_06070 [Chloroflexota bacterium]|nr:hypothetical protein [Chloroflexota bacterium]